MAEDAVGAPFASGAGWSLHLGDALEVLRTLPEGSADAIVTDPPYASGGRQQATARGVVSKARSREDADWFLGDNMGLDTYLWWMREVAHQALRICTPGAPAQVFTDWRQYGTITTAWESVGWTLKNVLVWDKDRGGALGSYWRNNHEFVALFAKGKARPLAHRGCFNTWRGAKPHGAQHPTEKPLGLMQYLVSTITPADALVLDPFTGSGTTGVAALSLGHRFLGIDRDLGYLAGARDRLQGPIRGATAGSFDVQDDVLELDI